MKVLILITKSNWGGAQRYVFDLATNLHKDKYDVSVMAGGNGPLIQKLQQAQVKANGDLPVGRDISIVEDIKAFFKLISILKKEKPDILHINSSKIGGLGSLAGRLVGIKRIIFTAHGWAFNENRTLVSKIIIGVLHWITIILSHKTISVSETSKSQTDNWPFINKKMVVVHNGIKIDPGFSKMNAQLELSRMYPQLSSVFKSSKDLVVIGSVGELHHIKGLNYALEAISGLNTNFIYIIIGTGEEKDRLEKQIKDLKLESKVFMLGFLENAYQYFRAFDIFLLPSLSEGLPYIALESGLSSLPTIATAVGGIPEVIDDMKSGILIQPRKPSEIKYGIEFYLKHKKTRKEHGLALHDKVLTEFSIEKMVKDTEKIYSNSL